MNGLFLDKPSGKAQCMDIREKSEFIGMNVFPFLGVFIVWREVFLLFAKGDEAQHLMVFRDIKDASHHVGSLGAVTQAPASDLHPTGSKAQILSLQLHGVSSDAAILHPTIVFIRTPQDHHSQCGIPDKGSPLLLGIRQLLEVDAVVHHHKLPLPVVSRRGRQQCRP